MGLVGLKTKKGKRKIFGGERSLDRQKRHKGIWVVIEGNVWQLGTRRRTPFSSRIDVKSMSCRLCRYLQRAPGHFIRCRMIVNYIVDKARKEPIVTDFNMSQDSPKGTRKNLEKPTWVLSVSGPILQLSLFGMPNRLTGTSQWRTAGSSNVSKSVVRERQRGLIKGSVMTA
jgi:hypothetical protein